MLTVTSANPADTLARIERFESRIALYGAVVQGWKGDSVFISVPQASEMKLSMFLSNNDFLVKA